jgi:tRNA(fMet)-specific endonuclease VapC
MRGRLLLDTNIVIALLADEAGVKTKLANADEVFLSSIALGELYFGAGKSGRPQANLTRIETFASDNVVLGCDAETARRYGEIKNALRVKGRPIPENDIWIAAIALQHNLGLITRDGHFNEVEGLRVEVW